MAMTLTCDLCDNEIKNQSIQVSMLDGEHPHNGSVIRRSVDVCISCIYKLNGLYISKEWDDVRSYIKGSIKCSS